ncbi:unnamed protein product (macronuclear) [Paramecium tetraurelia]|uniref:Casein kinase I n=1 Tax=Paramecium tetraurelia TaxID=5888 RepID=A0CZ95_PARTE|nr:uncharacterized protein GSPATT00011685001 [Paramecium tetraurelia]CAK76112.1 unnamed protein product [Paramecium tetraurelia]|eukprot:XP_001443509.1 hypothetical protein (macronuclear) [Paramecium tetraurelia strain d4-2]
MARSYRSLSVQKENHVFSGYSIQNKINKGGFGSIYKGIDKSTNQEVAIKHSQFDLKKEYQIMTLLSNVGGIPKVYDFKEQERQSFMSMELLSQDLHTIKSKFKQFSLKCICLIAIKVLEILKQVHQMNVVHRDIKPTNLMVKSLKDPQIYLIDFGIAKDQSRTEHRLEFEGTFLYDPISVHKRQKYRFLDDIEMLAYTLVFLYNGHLPWKKYGNEVLANEDALKQKEQYINSKAMTQLPFADLFGYIKWNQHKQKPDYEFLINMFRNILREKKLNEDYQFDWMEQATPALKRESKHLIVEDLNTDLNEAEQTYKGVSFLSQLVYKFFKD